MATTKAKLRESIDVTVEMCIGHIAPHDVAAGTEFESVEEAAFNMIARHGAQHGLDKACYRVPITGEGTLEVRTQFVPH